MDRHTKRETGRQTFKERGKQIYREGGRGRHTKRSKQTYTDTQRGRQTDIQRERQTYKERGRQTDIQRDRQTDRHTKREREADMEAIATYISVTSVVSVAVPLAPLTAVVTPDALPLLVGGTTVTSARALAP